MYHIVLWKVWGHNNNMGIYSQTSVYTIPGCLYGERYVLVFSSMRAGRTLLRD